MGLSCVECDEGPTEVPLKSKPGGVDLGEQRDLDEGVCVQERLKCTERDGTLIRGGEVALERLDEDTFDARPVEAPGLSDLAPDRDHAAFVRGDLAPVLEFVASLFRGRHEGDGDRRVGLGRENEHDR